MSLIDLNEHLTVEVLAFAPENEFFCLTCVKRGEYGAYWKNEKPVQRGGCCVAAGERGVRAGSLVTTLVVLGLVVTPLVGVKSFLYGARTGGAGF